MPKVEGVLGRIGEATRARVADLKKRLPIQKLTREPLYRRKPRDFAAALGAGLSVIAEVKFASPSGGRSAWSASAKTAQGIAGAYLENGARALSILTEPDFFAGAPKFLSVVREKFPDAPILMKDFFIDVHQFELARACGADAVLLIVALVGPKLGELMFDAQGLGLSALVEVHDEAELAAARGAGARLIGVNNRDLKTLTTDLGVAHRLAPLALGEGITLVAESGIKEKKDIAALARVGYNAFLIGTELMAAGDPGAALRRMLA